MLLKSKLKVIFCIGETLREKKKKKTKSILSKQIKFGLDKINKKKIFLLLMNQFGQLEQVKIPKIRRII